LFLGTETQTDVEKGPRAEAAQSRLARSQLAISGVVLFLYGSDHTSNPIGLAILAPSVLLLSVFFWWATNKGGDAIFDLQLFKGKIFSAAVVAHLSQGCA